jgi:Cof subfamily protein (haloacid dehalogenase superfamily)
MKSRFYISDLDKTLLRSDLSISDFTKNIWNELAHSGVKLSIATARSTPKTFELLKDLKLNHPLIVMDGALIVSNEGDVLLSNSLSYDEVDAILEISDKEKVYPFIIGVDENGIDRFRHSTTLNSLQQELVDEYKNDKRIQECSVLKPLRENIKIVYIGSKSQMHSLKDQIHDKLKDSVEIKLQKDVYQDGYFLTLLHPKGDKSHALKELQDITGIQSSMMTVFGDSHNDVGMFKVASQRIAVANAENDLKELSTHILPHTNDQDAVAKYLTQIMK